MLVALFGCFLLFGTLHAQQEAFLPYSLKQDYPEVFDAIKAKDAEKFQEHAAKISKKDRKAYGSDLVFYFIEKDFLPALQYVLEKWKLSTEATSTIGCYGEPPEFNPDVCWGGQTPLIAAALAGRVEIVQYLLKRKAKVNAKDKLHKKTALQLTENEEIQKLLRKNGAK